MHILASPERDICSQCGVENLHIRCCICDNVQTKLCRGCWRDFINDECKVVSKSWRDDVTRVWYSKTVLRLIFEGENGTAQRARLWN